MVFWYWREKNGCQGPGSRCFKWIAYEFIQDTESPHFKSKGSLEILRPLQKLKLICKLVQFLVWLWFYVPIQLFTRNYKNIFSEEDHIKRLHTFSYKIYVIQLKKNREAFHFLLWYYKCNQFCPPSVKQLENRFKYVKSCL